MQPWSCYSRDKTIYVRRAFGIIGVCSFYMVAFSQTNCLISAILSPHEQERIATQRYNLSYAIASLARTTGTVCLREREKVCQYGSK